MFQLPRRLRKKWQIVEALRQTGAQAALYLVERRTRARERAVFKLYAPGLWPDSEAHQRLRAADSDHLVRILASEEEDGIWYELLEYVPGGTLADLLRREGHPLPEERVRAILDELTAGIARLHAEVQAVHRDIKPSNVLVRTANPLSLAIADFGTVATLGDRTARTVIPQRTVAYAAPEAGQKHIGYSADWWSLGIILVEALTGRHPFSDAEGQLLETDEILHRLAQRPTDELVEGVPDRWRDLCRGLLRGRPANRWDQRQVLLWQSGQTPPVEDEPRGVFNYRPFRFQGEELWDPRLVARALAANWAPARLSVGRGEVLNWVRDEIQDAALLSDLQDHEGVGSLDVQLLRTLITLHPGMVPTLRGWPLTREGLARLASDARRDFRVGGGSEGDADTVSAASGSALAALQLLYDERVLEQCALATSATWYNRLDQTWRAQMSAVARAADVLPPDARGAMSAGLPLAAAAALGTLVGDESVLAELELAAAPARRPALLDCDWFRIVLERSQNAAALFALMPSLAPFAAAPADRARRRQRAEAQQSSQRRLAQFVAGTALLIGLAMLTKACVTFVHDHAKAPAVASSKGPPS